MKDFTLQHKKETLYNSHSGIILAVYPLKFKGLVVFNFEQKKKKS